MAIEWDATADRPAGSGWQQRPLRLPACIAVAVFVAGLIIATTASAQDSNQTRLIELDNAITAIEQWVSETRQQRSAEERELDRLGAEARDLSQLITENEQQLANLDNQLRTLESQRRELLQRSDSQRQQIAEALRATYQAGSESQLKLLLNQQDPATTQRMLVYFEHINQDRLEQIRQWRQTLSQIESNADELSSAQAAVTQQSDLLKTRQEALAQAQQHRREIIASLDVQLAERGGELSQLQQDRQELQELIDEINRIVEDIPAPEDLMPFADSRGNMPWPVRGELLARYGDRYSDGNLQRQGIIIAAEAGSAVRAIHPGRVVFADWLRGSGNLIVVDHGNAYLSLYAHQQTLNKQSGDWVNRGEPVGTAGTDAGMGMPGLYFEIRRNSQTLNPVEWLETVR